MNLHGQCPKCSASLSAPQVNPSCTIPIAIRHARDVQGDGRYGHPQPSAEDIAKATKARQLPGLYQICVGCKTKVVHCTCVSCNPYLIRDAWMGRGATKTECSDCSEPVTFDAEGRILGHYACPNLRRQ